MNDAVSAFDAAIVPDSSKWGQGYGRPYTTDEIYEIYANRDDEPFEGYGPLLREWLAPNEDGRVILSEGCDAFGTERQGKDQATVDPGQATSLSNPWSVNPGVRAWMEERGWTLDQHGRGLHPHWEQLQSCRIRLNTGPGIGYYYGEQVVADAVVTDGSGVVLINRPHRTAPDSTFPALPGGYSLPRDFDRNVDQWLTGDRPVTADGIIRTALRKFKEEAGVDLPRATKATIVRAIRPISSAHTLNFWTVTYTVRVQVDSLATLEPTDTAEVFDARDIDPLESRMWPDHFRALRAALTL